MPRQLTATKTSHEKWRGGGGKGGGSPGEQGAGGVRETGEERPEKRDLYDGGKRERNSKTQAFVICYCSHPVKETNPTMFLDFH